MEVASPEVKKFRSRLESELIYDPKGPHHELASGNHARKVDFDKIKTASWLYNDWIELSASHIAELPLARTLAIVGVSNGANRLARDIPRLIGSNVVGLSTRKAKGEILLTSTAINSIAKLKPASVLIVDDVGTTGGSIAEVAHNLSENTDIEYENMNAHVSWQRQERLESLDELGISYSALINEVLPIYTPAECEAEGFCSQGVPLIFRGE